MPCEPVSRNLVPFEAMVSAPAAHGAGCGWLGAGGTPVLLLLHLPVSFIFYPAACLPAPSKFQWRRCYAVTGRYVCLASPPNLTPLAHARVQAHAIRPAPPAGASPRAVPPSARRLPPAPLVRPPARRRGGAAPPRARRLGLWQHSYPP